MRAQHVPLLLLTPCAGSAFYFSNCEIVVDGSWGRLPWLGRALDAHEHLRNPCCDLLSHDEYEGVFLAKTVRRL